MPTWGKFALGAAALGFLTAKGRKKIGRAIKWGALAAGVSVVAPKLGLSLPFLGTAALTAPRR